MALWFPTISFMNEYGTYETVPNMHYLKVFFYYFFSNSFGGKMIFYRLRRTCKLPRKKCQDGNELLPSRRRGGCRALLGLSGPVAEFDPRGNVRPLPSAAGAREGHGQQRRGGGGKAGAREPRPPCLAEAQGGQGVTRVRVPWSPSASNPGLP